MEVPLPFQASKESHACRSNDHDAKINKKLLHSHYKKRAGVNTPAQGKTILNHTAFILLLIAFRCIDHQQYCCNNVHNHAHYRNPAKA